MNNYRKDIERDSVNEECVAELVGILKGIKQQYLFKINKVVQY